VYYSWRASTAGALLFIERRGNICTSQENWQKNKDTKETETESSMNYITQATDKKLKNPHSKTPGHRPQAKQTAEGLHLWGEQAQSHCIIPDIGECLQNSCWRQQVMLHSREQYYVLPYHNTERAFNHKRK
jgi:hypothetical protein